MVDATDADAALEEPFEHPGREPLEIVLGKEPAADPGLVGDDNRDEARFLGRPAQIEDTGQELEILDSVNVVLLDVDDAIAVEKQCPVHADRPLLTWPEQRLGARVVLGNSDVDEQSVRGKRHGPYPGDVGHQHILFERKRAVARKPGAQFGAQDIRSAVDPARP